MGPATRDYVQPLEDTSSADGRPQGGACGGCWRGRYERMDPSICGNGSEDPSICGTRVVGSYAVCADRLFQMACFAPVHQWHRFVSQHQGCFLLPCLGCKLIWLYGIALHELECTFCSLAGGFQLARDKAPYKTPDITDTVNLWRPPCLNSR